MNKNGSNIYWMKHIENRVGFAQQWRNEGLETHKRLAERFIYIRINGTKFRPISIIPDNPCGRLLRKGDRAKLNGVANIKRVIQAAENAMPADCFAPAGGRENAKPEHKIQARLIRCALQNNLAFQSLFEGFDHVFDELLFVTDELSAGDLRADVIALGRKSETYFPVLIELKVGRELTRLKEQLEKAREAMGCVQEVFVQFLSAVTGVEKHIAFAPRLILVWRDSESGQESKEVSDARDLGFITGALRNERVHFVGNKSNG
jgi:hypothetical protein